MRSSSSCGVIRRLDTARVAGRQGRAEGCDRYHGDRQVDEGCGEVRQGVRPCDEEDYPGRRGGQLRDDEGIHERSPPPHVTRRQPGARRDGSHVGDREREPEVGGERLVARGQRGETERSSHPVEVGERTVRTDEEGESADQEQRGKEAQQTRQPPFRGAEWERVCRRSAHLEALCALTNRAVTASARPAASSAESAAASRRSAAASARPAAASARYAGPPTGGSD